MARRNRSLPPPAILISSTPKALQLLVLGAGDGLRHDAGHAEAERLRAGRRAQGRVSHRRHDQLRVPPFATQVVQQMRRAANLETARRGEELALGVDLMPRKEVAQADQRRLHKGKHDSWSSMGAFPALSGCYALPRLDFGVDGGLAFPSVSHDPPTRIEA